MLETHMSHGDQCKIGFSPQIKGVSQKNTGREISIVNQNWRTLRLLYSDYRHAQDIRKRFANWERDRKQRVVGTKYAEKLSMDPLFWVWGMTDMLKRKTIRIGGKREQLRDYLGWEPEQYFPSLMKAELECNLAYVEFLQHIRGIDVKLACAFLGFIGDPSRFKGLRSLWHYCGYHVSNLTGKAVKREKKGFCKSCLGKLKRMGEGGVKEELCVKCKEFRWNPQLKSLLYNVGESFIKQGNVKYKGLYDQYKREVNERMDVIPSSQKSSYVKKHSETVYEQDFITMGHLHNRARRLMIKRFLKDFWSYLHGPETHLGGVDRT